MKNKFMYCGVLFLMPHFVWADETTVNINANIISNTCNMVIENNGAISLASVSTGYFTAPRTPTTFTDGQRFVISVESCVAGGPEKLHFTFAPQGGALSDASPQVFANATLAGQGGAQGVGLVVFSEKLGSNVLDSSGNSDVVYDITGLTPEQYYTDYDFSVRYQQTGTVVPGKVTANVVVGVSYD